MTPVRKSVPIEEIVDFCDQLELFERMLAGPHEKRLLFIRSAGTSGKTTLLRLMRHRCGVIPSSWVDFRGNPFDNPHFTLAHEICDQLGFSPWYMARALQPLSGLPLAGMEARTDVGGNVTDSVIVTQVLMNISPADESLRGRHMQERLKRAFIEDMKAHTRRAGTVVCFVDALEHISPQEEDWLIDALLVPIAEGQLGQVIVVTGGRRWPNVEPRDWEPCAHLVPKLPKLTVEDFKAFGERIGHPLSDEQARFAWRGCERGNPMLMGMFIKNLRATAGGGE